MHYERKIKYLDYYESGEKIRGAGFLKLEVKEDKLRMELTVKGLYPTDTFDREVLLHSSGREAALGKICIQNGAGSFRYAGDLGQNIGDTGISYAALQEIRIPIGGTRELICPLTETTRTYKLQPQSPHQMNVNVQEERASEMAEVKILPAISEAQETLKIVTKMSETVEGRITETEGTTVETEGVAEVESEVPGMVSEAPETPSEVSEVASAKVDISVEAGEAVPEEAEVSEAEDPAFAIAGMSLGAAWEAVKAAGTSAEISGAAMAAKMPAEMAVDAGAVAEKKRDIQESIELQADLPETQIETPEVQKDVQGQGLSKKLFAELGKTEAKTSQDGNAFREARKRHADRSRPINMREEKWQQLSEIYPHIQPFHDKRDYLSICPDDFVLFPSKFYKAVNNSFLLHGYYNYDHLILARMRHQGEIQYYIGVPGTYFDREKQVAIMFGFESFECASEPAQTGDFGYYMMRMEL